jgi:hypothetical protein
VIPGAHRDLSEAHRSVHVPQKEAATRNRAARNDDSIRVPLAEFLFPRPHGGRARQRQLALTVIANLVSLPTAISKQNTVVELNLAQCPHPLAERPKRLTVPRPNARGSNHGVDQSSPFSDEDAWRIMTAADIAPEATFSDSLVRSLPPVGRLLLRPFHERLQRPFGVKKPLALERTTWVCCISPSVFATRA